MIINIESFSLLFNETEVNRIFGGSAISEPWTMSELKENILPAHGYTNQS